MRNAAEVCFPQRRWVIRVWALVGGVWLFVLHGSGEGPLLW